MIPNYRIKRKTKQRMGQKKFQKLKQHSFFLAKHIRRFVSFNLIEQASFFTDNLFQLLWENPKLRKKHPILAKIVQEVDAILWEKGNIDNKLGI